MGMTPPFSAAIFDLDGTISASSELHRQAFNETLRPFKVQLSRETYLRIYEGTSSRFILSDALQRHGLLSGADIEALRQESHQRFRRLAQEQLLPVRGFPRFFDGLRASRVPSIIATNGDGENVRLVLAVLKLEEERVVTGAEAGKLKPDPALYLLAAARLGKRPEECVVFEDSVTGVLAAKRAGCYCACVLTTTERERLEEAGVDLIIEDFTKLSPGMLFAQKP